jgi:hypothetical protein
MTSASRLVIAGGHTLTTAVMMTNSVGTALGRGAHKKPRHAGLGRDIVHTDAGGPITAVAVGITRARADSLWRARRGADRTGVHVTVRLTLAGLSYPQIVDGQAVEGPAGLVPTRDPWQAGARQADTELILSDHTNKGRG